jgi:hypothetical protein
MGQSRGRLDRGSTATRNLTTVEGPGPDVASFVRAEGPLVDVPLVAPGVRGHGPIPDEDHGALREGQMEISEKPRMI